MELAKQPKNNRKQLIYSLIQKIKKTKMRMIPRIIKHETDRSVNK